MQFHEITPAFLSAKVRYSGHASDGKTIVEAMPHMENLRVWRATHGGYSWVISFDPGLPQWSDADRAEYCGYTASYRRIDQHTSNETIKIDGGPWDTFSGAERACQQVWKQIRRPS